MDRCTVHSWLKTPNLNSVINTNIARHYQASNLGETPILTPPPPHPPTPSYSSATDAPAASATAHPLHAKRSPPGPSGCRIADSTDPPPPSPVRIEPRRPTIQTQTTLPASQSILPASRPAGTPRPWRSRTLAGTPIAGRSVRRAVAWGCYP